MILWPFLQPIELPMQSNIIDYNYQATPSCNSYVMSVMKKLTVVIEHTVRIHHYVV